MIVGYVAIAALMGVKLTHLEIHTCGDIDLQGFFGLDPAVVPGYESLQQTVTIAGDGTPDQFRKIHEREKQTSPNYLNTTHAIGLHSRLKIQWGRARHLEPFSVAKKPATSAKPPHLNHWPRFLPVLVRDTSRKGILRTLRRSKNHPTKIKRSRTRLQLVLRENWYRGPAVLC